MVSSTFKRPHSSKMPHGLGADFSAFQILKSDLPKKKERERENGSTDPAFQQFPFFLCMYIYGLKHSMSVLLHVISSPIVPVKHLLGLIGRSVHFIS